MVEFWVRFEAQTEDEAVRVSVPCNGLVDDLRTAIIAKFPELLQGPTDIATLHLDNQVLLVALSFLVYLFINCR